MPSACLKYLALVGSVVKLLMSSWIQINYSTDPSFKRTDKDSQTTDALQTLCNVD